MLIVDEDGAGAVDCVVILNEDAGGLIVVTVIISGERRR